MHRFPGVIVAVVLAAASLVASQREQISPSIDLIEVDAVVIDHDGRPVTGLSQADFRIKEDGKPVEITTFTEVSPTTADADDRMRSVVILLDDTGVMPVGTKAVQTIARALVDSAAMRDEVSVVRLHSRVDEPFGDRRVATSRIVAYQAGSFPFSDWVTPQESMERIADLSRQMSENGAKRKIIVCVGAPAVCNVSEPAPIEPRGLWPRWVDVLRATANANVAVYAVIPGRVGLRGGGLVDFTGGELFATTYDISPAIQRILQDASFHYLLGYWPPPADGKTRELHSIQVKVNRRGAKVLARHQRAS